MCSRFALSGTTLRGGGGSRGRSVARPVPRRPPDAECAAAATLVASRRNEDAPILSPAALSRGAPPVTATSCGVLVTDGILLLLGHATGSPRWDIPKGLAEGAEAFEAAARRELREETGLVAPADALRPLGVHRYRAGKRLALFVWRVQAMPSPETLVCVSLFQDRWGRMRPEFDRFGVFGLDEALGLVGAAMAAVLAPVLAGEV